MFDANNFLKNRAMQLNSELDILNSEYNCNIEKFKDSLKDGSCEIYKILGSCNYYKHWKQNRFDKNIYWRDECKILLEFFRGSKYIAVREYEDYKFNLYVEFEF